MSRPSKFPKVDDVDWGSLQDQLHMEIDGTWAEGETAERFCGDNCCSGKCNLPALVISLEGRTRKASGSQVAMGLLMQDLRVKWEGQQVEVPEAHRADFLGRWYW